MQLRRYVPGIGIFALNEPSWREFKDENVSVYLKQDEKQQFILFK